MRSERSYIYCYRRKQKSFCCQGAQAVTARPYVKGGLEGREGVGK